MAKNMIKINIIEKRNVFAAWVTIDETMMKHLDSYEFAGLADSVRYMSPSWQEGTNSYRHVLYHPEMFEVSNLCNVVVNVRQKKERMDVRIIYIPESTWKEYDHAELWT